MKIKKIYIENFGTVSDYSLEMKDGVNTVLEDNGWGKSTVAAFVRIMFYGLEGDRSRKNIRDNERNFYRPWNGGVFGGAIEFETEKGTYILTRTFGSTKKDDDTFDLRDAVTQKESTDYNSEDIGRVLFGIDSDSYQKTSFISHESIKYSGVGSEVGSKVSSAPQGDDLAVYDKACELMKNYLNSHSPRGAKGSLSKQKTEMAELKRETDRIADVTKRLDAEKEALRGITEEYSSLKQKRKHLEREKKGLLLAREKSLKKKTYLEKKDSVSKRENEIKSLLENSGTAKPDEELMSRAEKKISEISALSVKLETKKSASLGDRFERLKAKYGEDAPESDEIQRKIDDMKSVQDMIHAQGRIEDQIEREKLIREENRKRQEQQRRERSLVLQKKQASSNGILIAGIIIAVIAICVAAVLFLLVPAAKVFAVVAGIVAVAGIVLIIIGAAGKSKLRTQTEDDEAGLVDESEENIARLSEESREYAVKIRNTEREVGDYLKKFDIEYYRSDAERILYSIKSEVAEYKENLKAEKIAAEEIEGISANGKALCDELKEIFGGLGVADAAPSFPGENTALKQKIEALRKTASEHAFLSAELEKARKDLADFMLGNPDIDEEEIPATEEVEAKEREIDENISRIDAELDDKGTEINGYQRRIDDLAGELEELNAKKDELDSLSESYSEELHRYGIVKKTEELLGKAKDSLISRYMAPLRCSFEKYYDILKGSGDADGAADYLIDTNLEIKKKEQGNYRDIQTLSDGLGDRVGLCMRAAFLDVMYSDEKPIVIMDDPFSNFDEKNLEWGWRFLELLSKEYQIIYMTCHADRMGKTS